LQAIKQQRCQNFWQFFPTLGNDFIAEQLERQKAQKQPSNGANCEGYIDAVDLSCSTLLLESMLGDSEGGYQDLLVIQLTQFRIDQHFRQDRLEHLRIGPQQGHALAQVRGEKGAQILLALRRELLFTFR